MSQTAKPFTAASDWFAKVRSGNLTAAEAQDFHHWLTQDSRHLDAYEQQKKLWCLANDLKSDSEFNSLLENTGNSAPNKITNNTSQWRPWAAAIAASILLVVTLMGTQIFTTHPQPSNTQTYFTQIGEHSVINLSDGSSISLNTNSLVEVRYSEQERQIKLIKGEALFRVAKDKARPFKVFAGHGVTTAVGTAFNVNYRQDKTQVDVLEGIVEVALLPKPNTPQGTTVTKTTKIPQLQAGESVAYGQTEGVTEKRTADLSRINAWQQGKLNFNAMSLADVVKERNRYSTVNLTIRDTELATLPVSGIFNVGDDQALLFALKNSFNIESKRYGNIIVLSAGNATKSELDHE